MRHSSSALLVSAARTRDTVPGVDHPVEMKVTQFGDVSATITRLQLKQGEDRRIWFAEDLSARRGDSDLPLLDAGVILRLRERKDTTAKLRRLALRDTLAGQWSHDHDKQHGFEFRIEWDWAGPRHVMAASAVTDLDDSVIEDAANGRRNLADVFCAKQLDFLHDCAGVPVELDRLTVLPPIAATKWSKWKGLDSDQVPPVNIERWQVSELDFLEFSVRAKAGEDVESMQKGFHAGLQRVGVPVEGIQETKTRVGVPVEGIQETKTRLVLAELVRLHG